MSSIRDHSAVLVAVIEAIFHDPCPRGFALNLSKAEMLTALVKTKCINPADLPEPGAGCPVEAVLPDSAARSCRAMGVEWIRQLVRFIRADLLTLPDIGETTANQIEAELAKRGLLLVDGDPAVLREDPPASWRIEGSLALYRYEGRRAQ